MKPTDRKRAILYWALPVGIGAGLADLVTELFTDRPIGEKALSVLITIVLGLIGGAVLGWAVGFRGPGSGDRPD